MSRRAFSLLEVVLALAILAGAVAVLSEITRGGLASAERARDLTQAELLCESKLAELASGLLPLEANADTPIEDLTGQLGTDWTYDVEVGPAAQTGLLEVRVTVTKGADTAINPVEFSLVRWFADPELASASDAAPTGGEP